MPTPLCCAPSRGTELDSATTSSAARLATPADPERIARPRSGLILSKPQDEEEIAQCSTQLAARLAPKGDARAYVIGPQTAGLVSCTLKLIRQVRPASACPKGPTDRAHAVATHPAFRRRGYFATAVMAALLNRRGQDCATLFELNAASPAFTNSPAMSRMRRLPAPSQRVEGVPR